jgi:hypothetical protein
MKIQRTPIILFAIAALLGSVVLITETQRGAKQAATQSTRQKLFPFEESDVQAFTLTTLTGTKSFQKMPAPATVQPKPDASKPQASASTEVWQITAPQKAIASEGAVAFLLNLVGTGRSEKTLQVPPPRLAEFGLDQPQATLDITLKNQKKHRLVLGNSDFNRTFMYAQIDPPNASTSDQTIHLVSLDFENAVNRPIEEWQQQAADKPQPLPPRPKP